MKFRRIIAFLLLVTLLCVIVPKFPAEMVHKVDAAGAVQGIESGQSYYLRVKKSNKCLDLQGSGITNGTHFQQYKQGDPSELFKITLQPNGYYTLQTTLIGAGGTMVMDGRSNCVAGAQVILYQFDTSCEEQYWEIRKNSNGTYSLSPKKNLSLNLAIEGASLDNNAKAKLETRNDSAENQQFIIENQQRAMNILSGQVFYLRNYNSEKYLNLQENGTELGTHFQQNEYNGEPCAQRVRITTRSDGYFTIQSVYASTDEISMVLDGGYEHCVAGSQVILFEQDDELFPEQAWHIRKADNGTLCLSPKTNVYVNLAVEGSSTAENAKIKLEGRNYNAANQQWCLEPVEDAKGFKGYAWRYPFTDNDFTEISSGYKKPNRPDHYAIDIISKNDSKSINGAPILSPMTGKVVYKNNNGTTAGYYVVVEYDSFWLGEGKKIRVGFAHLNAPITWSIGDKVWKDDVIGYVGNTGHSSGPHLQLSVFFGEDVDWAGVTNSINPQRFFPWTNFVGDLSSVRP